MKRKIILLLITLEILMSGCSAEKDQEDILIAATETIVASLQEYTMEVKTTLSESNSLYVTFGLTAPEHMDLSALLDRTENEYLSFGDLLAVPSATNYPANLSYTVEEDADGLDNTVNVIFQIIPVIPDGGEPAFGSGKTCEISFATIQKRNGSQPKEILASGNWEFTIDMDAADQEEIQLLHSPVTVTSEIMRQGKDDNIIPISKEPVTLTSIVLSAQSMTIHFEKPEPLDTFSSLYVDQDAFLMMKDGRKIGFFQSNGAKESAFLSAEEPILLTDANYLQFSDGTRVEVHTK